MHDSGFNDSRHNSDSSHQPVWRPIRNISESPDAMHTMDPPTVHHGFRSPRAQAAPATSRASAAGMGKPNVSKNATANSMRYPCSAMRAIQDSTPIWMGNRGPRIPLQGQL